MLCAPSTAGEAPHDQTPHGPASQDTDRRESDPEAIEGAEVKVEPDAGVTEFLIVEGQVIDAVGGGESGVKVVVQRISPDGKEGETIATTVTDQLGDFRVTSAEPVRGAIRVTFSKPMYATLVRRLDLAKDDEPPYLAEQLEGQVVVIGRVEDAVNHKPVAGASVTLEVATRDFTAKTDEGGSFMMKHVIPGSGMLVIKADGYGRERQSVARLEDFGEIRVLIKPERIVRVIVTDPAGTPLAGATVECLDAGRDDFRTLVTDKQGSVAFRGLHFDARALRVRLTHDEYVSSLDLDREIELPRDQAETSHTLVMQPAGRIAGTITAAQGGEPLQGARVITGLDEQFESPRDWADFEGHYEIRGVEPGSVTVTIHLSGYAPELKSIDVVAGQAARVDASLREGAVVRGIVRSADTQPMDGVYVQTRRWRGATTLGLRAMTGADGMFVIDSAPHDEFEVVAYALDGREVAATVKGGGEPIELVLPKASSKSFQPSARGPGMGATAPSFSVTTLEGKPVKLSDLKGKTVLLDFWATWCVPCVADLPNLLAVHEQFGARKDFVMIGISLDVDEKALRDFIKNRKIAWVQVFGDGADRIAKRYGVEGIPAMFLIDPEGKIVAADVSGKALAATVKEVLQENDPT